MWWLEVLVLLLIIILLLARFATIAAGALAAIGILLYLFAEFLKVAFYPAPFQIVMIDFDWLAEWVLNVLYGATAVHVGVMISLLLMSKPATTSGPFAIASLLLIIFWRKIHEIMSKPLG